MSFDVVVIGAGVSGCAAAYFSAEQGLRVALLDRQKAGVDKVCTSTVNPRSRRYLGELGALDGLESEALLPILGLQTFAYDDGSFQGLYRPPDQPPTWGHTIPRYLLDAALRQAVLARGGIEPFDLFTVEEVSVAGDGRVEIRGLQQGSPRFLSATVVIDAAGRGSPIAARRGLFEPWPEHRRFAAMAQFSGVEWNAPLFSLGTNEEIGPGYYCVFPITADRAIVALIVTEKDWPRVSADAGAELDRFTAGPWRLREWFGRARRETPAMAFGPLAFRSRAFHLERIFMVGDTTGFYDPLTGEGMTFGFHSGQLAARLAGRVVAGLAWAEAAALYAAEVQTLKQEAWGHAEQLQRMLKFPGAFNRFVQALGRNQRAADWLACALGNLLPPGERRPERLQEILSNSLEEGGPP